VNTNASNSSSGVERISSTVSPSILISGMVPTDNCSRSDESGSVGRCYRRVRVTGWSRAALKSCCNKAISDGVSIRGIFEVASFRPGKLGESEPESLAPPVFEVLSMLVSQCLNFCFVGSQLDGVGSSGQRRGYDDVTASGFDEPDEIRHRTGDTGANRSRNQRMRPRS